MPGNVVNTSADLRAIGVGTAPFTDGFNVIVKDINGDGSILPLTYIWLNRSSVANGLKVIKPDNNLGGWYLMQVLGEALPAIINATELNDEPGSFYLDRSNHTGTQSFSTISGLGNAATKNVGTGSSDVAAGNDSRFGQATNALSFNGQSASFYLNRSNHTGNIALTSLDLLTGYSVGSAVAINATDSILSAFGKAQAQLNNKPELVGGLIPSSMLPSYVDDVLEYANLASFPVTGESGKLYIAIDTNLVYRWTGSTYAGTSSALALGETSTTAYRGDRGKTAYDHVLLTSGNPHATTKGDVGLGSVDNTSDGNKPVSTAQQTALNLKANVANAAFTGTTTGITASMVGLGNVANLAQVDTATTQASIAGAKTFTSVATFTANAYIGPELRVSNVGFPKIVFEATSNGADLKKFQCFVDVSGSYYFALLNDAESVSAGAFIVARTGVVSFPSGCNISGTNIKYVLSAVVTWDIPSTVVNDSAIQDFTVTGASVNAFVSVCCLSETWFTASQSGFLTGNVTAPNTVRVRWNAPHATINSPSATFRILVIGF